MGSSAVGLFAAGSSTMSSSEDNLTDFASTESLVASLEERLDLHSFQHY